MKRFPELNAELAAFVARLVDAEDSPACDRILLEAALAASSGIAAALWIRRPDGWQPLLERGPADALPRGDMVRALLAGTLSMDVLPSGQTLVRTGDADGDVALTLGGVHEGGSLDVVDALLHLRRLIENEGTGADSLPHPPHRSPPSLGGPGALPRD